jgi:hypothetical protein
MNEIAPMRRKYGRLRSLVALGIGAIGSCWSIGPGLADDGYELGHGYTVGAFNFAGYSELAIGLPDEGSQKIALEDLSLFITGHVNRLFNPFVEAELTHFDFSHSGPNDADRGDGTFVLERLYDDVELNDSFTLRLGKMLAPVGAWNEIHAAPLVLATNRPAVTNRNFSEYLTGASLNYADPDGEGPGVQVYWQPDREFSERPSTITFDQYKMVAGLHVTEPLSLRDQIGFSFQRSRDSENVNHSLFGLDFKYTIERLTLQGEATYSLLSGGTSVPPRHQDQDELGAYFAGSYALGEKWSVYGWYEEFAGRDYASASRDLLTGIAFHPYPAMVIKVEYLQNIGGPSVNPTGLFMSWSVLF